MKKLRTKIDKIKQTRWFTIASNKFVLATVGFIIWMLFLDVNSYLIHHELNTEIDELERSIEYYEAEISRDKKQLEELKYNPIEIAKFEFDSGVIPMEVKRMQPHEK